MIRLVKNFVLFLFFGVVPIALVSFLVFAGIKIYNVKNPKTLQAIDPKANSVASNKNEITSPKTSVDITSDFKLEDPLLSPKTSQTLKALDTKVELKDSVLLDIPLVYQKYNLNCEATSLAMALNYRGIKITQEEVFTKIGYAEPFKKIRKDGKIIWGDPDLGFVGNERGYLFTTQTGLAGGNGWGVNNGPVAKAAEIYRPGSIEKDGATIEDLKQALSQDKPVIFWHARDDARQEVLTYFTPEGKEVKQFQNHVNLLIGYKTDSKGNTIYTFNDPIYGVIKLTEKELIKEWARFNNEIVVVN